MTIGFVAGVASFGIVILIRRDQIADVIRCYVYAALCALLATATSPLDYSSVVIGGVIGWSLAAIQNAFAEHGEAALSMTRRKLIRMTGIDRLTGFAYHHCG